MKPIDVDSTNEQLLLDTVYNYKKVLPHTTEILSSSSKAKKSVTFQRSSQFKVGDSVRISKYRTLFDKGYTRNWSYEIFTITKVLYHTYPITYLLKDYNNEPIKGCFYPQELQLVKHPDVYLVEKIVGKRKGEVRVKWLGLGPEHNTWVSKKDLLKK